MGSKGTVWLRRWHLQCPQHRNGPVLLVLSLRWFRKVSWDVQSLALWLLADRLRSGM